MATPLSFQGISTGLQTDLLIDAILQQEAQPLQRMQDRQTRNNQRLAALQTLKTNMTSLSSSLATLGGTSFGARSVSSTDINNTYVSASASKAAVGSYDLLVSQVATKGRISPTLVGGVPSNLAVADPLTTPVFSGTSASFAVQGTDGVIKTLTLEGTNNTLYGLRDAINALGTADPNVVGSTGLGVTATVVNTGSGANPYQLVLTAKDTGTGTTGGVVTFADVTPGGAVNTLGIPVGTVDSLTAPTSLSGGLSSAVADAAKDALFTVNGIQLTRESNTVTDAVDGVTFTLKQGGQTTPTTFTVALDKAAITSAMQDAISKFNALVKTYKDASVSGGALANDPSVRSMIAQVRSAFSGSPEGLPATAAFTSTADLGIKTNRDGSLSLDVTAFQSALDTDPDAAQRVFAFTGESTNGVVSFYSGGSKTVTGAVGFNITSYVSGGAIAGTFTVAGTDYLLAGSSGAIAGTVGTPLEGLILSISGTGTGTLNLTRGVGQSVQDAVSGLTASTTGNIPQILTSINDQNATLTRQIGEGEARLDRRREVLVAQFAKLEATVGQLQAAGQSLSGIR
ncbi:MAG: flagellar filament capping protein FliD [Geothrix sp.]|nr:flagellar filament capping protein FliD [Geothrix sp.]